MTMTTATIDLQVIQQQIQSNGAFSPLHWVLESGYLPYTEYENWRHGIRANLDDAFTLDKDELISLLEQAAKHSTALKLCAESQDFYAWDNEHTGRALKISQQQELGQLLAKRWVRPEDMPQMDLFMDAGPVEAENQLINAIAQRQWSEAEQAYQQFCEIAAKSTKLGDYENLLLYGKYTTSPENITEEQALEELEALMAELAPKAQDLLRHQARDYLGAAWKRLAQYLPSKHFNPEQPKQHSSFAYAQLPDWPQVAQSIKQVPDYQEHAALLKRLADSYWYQYEEIALLLLAQAATREGGETLLDEVQQARFKNAWSAFWELDLSVEHFPAWQLLKEPGLLHFLEALPVQPDNDALFNAAKALIASKDDELANIKARQALKALSEPLLDVYLGRSPE